MKKLIKLELRKNNIRPYVIAVAGIFCTVTLLGIFFAAIPEIEPKTPQPHQFLDPKILITIISVTNMSIFAVLASIMYSKIIIEEFTGTHNILLFTYPQNKGRIFLAKFILVFCFIFIAALIVGFLASFLASTLSYLIGIRVDPFFTAGMAIKLGLLFALTANLIGIISLRSGFYKKSIIAPIITSVILITPFGNSAAILGQISPILFIATSALFLAVSIGLLTGLLKTVNKMECL